MAKVIHKMPSCVGLKTIEGLDRLNAFNQFVGETRNCKRCNSEKIRHIRLRLGDPNILCEQPGLLIPIQTEIFSYYGWKDVLKYWKNNVMCEICTQIFRSHRCSQYPFCYTCELASEVTLRICSNCYLFEWDESKYCDCGLELVHGCKGNYWHCTDSICQGIQQQYYEDGVMDEYLLEQAGGLDEVQRQERLRHYGEE